MAEGGRGEGEIPKVHFNAECGGMCNSAESARLRRKMLQSAPSIFPRATKRNTMQIAKIFFIIAKLHAAVRRGDAAEVQRLIDKGAEVNAKRELGTMPLHYGGAGKRGGGCETD